MPLSIWIIKGRQLAERRWLMRMNAREGIPPVLEDAVPGIQNVILMKLRAWFGHPGTRKRFTVSPAQKRSSQRLQEIDIGLLEIFSRLYGMPRTRRPKHPVRGKTRSRTSLRCSGKRR